MPYKVNGLRSWNMNAESFESVVRFYRDALGAEETTRHQVVGANVVRLKLGHTGLGVFDAKDGPRPGVPHHTFAFKGHRNPNETWRDPEPNAHKSKPDGIPAG